MNIIQKAVKEIKFIAKLADHPIRIYRYLLLKVDPKIKSFRKISSFFHHKKGLEIGGPSRIFSAGQYIPIYPIAKQIDGCNFSNNTVWENTITEGPTYKTGSQIVGYQYIMDGMDLSIIPSESYDFILSSHSLEHIANPIKALKEWLRVIKVGGAIVLVLPDSKYTFDHRRPITRFEHLLDDYNNNTNEDDQTHLDEVLSNHDVSLDHGVKDMEQFKLRLLDNINNRCMHQHVFNLSLLKQVLQYLNVSVIVSDSSFPHHLTIVGLKK